jgi:hypothetical protein
MAYNPQMLRAGRRPTNTATNNVNNNVRPASPPTPEPQPKTHSNRVELNSSQLSDLSSIGPVQARLTTALLLSANNFTQVPPNIEVTR